jgi:hypothetical protein
VRRKKNHAKPVNILKTVLIRMDALLVEIIRRAMSLIMKSLNKNTTL